MDKNYYLIFHINFLDDRSKALQSLEDVQNNGNTNDPLFIRGFSTKAAMKRFYDEFKDAIRNYTMLKPIS